MPDFPRESSCNFTRFRARIQPRFALARLEARNGTVAIIKAASTSNIHCDIVGIELPPEPGPPWSTIDPFAVRSSSPNPPSVMLNVTVFPVMTAGSTYQCGVELPGVGPYL